MTKKLALILLCLFLLCSCTNPPHSAPSDPPLQTLPSTLDAIPQYKGSPYEAIGDNVPEFDKLTDKSYEYYGELDELGRCTVTHACIGRDIMPTEDRESIGMIKPSGWQTAKYDFVDGKYLYNRCHLIGFQLAGENANEKNLITGTRSMNVLGMLPFENLVADYVRETSNHVMYRVTPVFSGDELVARGVRMEGFSVEDEGEGVCFDVFVFNVETGVIIDYSDGSNRLAPQVSRSASTEGEYVLNLSSKKIHLPQCSGVESMREENKRLFTGDIRELTEQGYTPCGICKPQ
ncbi:MAG: hypothetical protein E7646_03185 [Ruminococcaceae bacterium]|nr:hypothetical protein [Oscillospiraceae bacterium]